MTRRLRVLVLGANGMLGHAVCREFARGHDVSGTVRGDAEALVQTRVLEPASVREGVDAARFDSLVQAVADVRPDAILNCIGIVKQAPEAKDPLVSLEINAVMPHRLARLARAGDGVRPAVSRGDGAESGALRAAGRLHPGVLLPPLRDAC